MKRNFLWIGAFLLGFMIIPSYSQFGFRGKTHCLFPGAPG
jgi:hypothetical protein